MALLSNSSHDLKDWPQLPLSRLSEILWARAGPQLLGDCFLALPTHGQASVRRPPVTCWIFYAQFVIAIPSFCARGHPLWQFYVESSYAEREYSNLKREPTHRRHSAARKSRIEKRAVDQGQCASGLVNGRHALSKKVGNYGAADAS